MSLTLPTIGGGGHTTLGDTLLLETLAHFNRERIPERYPYPFSPTPNPPKSIPNIKQSRPRQSRRRMGRIRSHQRHILADQREIPQRDWKENQSPVSAQYYRRGKGQRGYRS